MPNHDGMADPVDAAATGSSGQLRVLPRCDRDMRLAVELHELLEHHGAGGHIDAQGQSLGGEDDLDDALREQLLDELFELRDHPGVVGRHTEQQAFAEGVESEDAEVLVGEFVAQLLDLRVDDDLLLLRVEVEAGGQILLDRFVAGIAGEDEHDRREHGRLGQRGHDLGPAGPPEASSGGTGTLRPRAAVGAGGMAESGIDPIGIGMREEVVHAVADEHVIDQRHGSVGCRDDRGRSPHLTQPGTEFLGVRDRGRQ